MKIEVIASGSGGNCYLINDGKTTLLLDAGIPLKQIRKAFPFLGRLEGVLVTHRHEDHCKAIRDLCHFGIKVYAKEDVIRHKELMTSPFAGIITASIREDGEAEKCARIGSFEVYSFPLEHDVPNLGFYIRSRETGETLLYFTDTHYIRYKLPDVQYLLGECNYCSKVLEQNVKDGIIPADLGHRIRKSHMSLETFLEFLKANNYTGLKRIYLLHLSDNNSDARAMKEAVQRLTGCEVHIA